MNLDKNLLEFLLQIIALIALVYRIAKAESMVYEAIDKVKDRLSEAIIKAISTMEMIEYRLNQVEKKIENDESELKIIERSLRDNGLLLKTRKDDRT